MKNGITQLMMDFLASLAGYGSHGLLVADVNDLPNELKVLWDRKLVSIYGDPSLKPLANGKITITTEGRNALQSLEALPLFNNAARA